MSEFWDEIDFGFDDLWAFLVMRARVAGVSIVAGKTPLNQMVANALGAPRTYEFDLAICTGEVLRAKFWPISAKWRHFRSC